MQQKTKLQSVLSGRCPRCREGKIFPHRAYSLAHFEEMNASCPFCGLKFEVEPGFFIGAMYISYAFSVAIFVFTGVLLYFLSPDPSVWVYVSVTFALILVLYPLSYRYSRIIYLHVFGGIRFSPDGEK